MEQRTELCLSELWPNWAISRVLHVWMELSKVLLDPVLRLCLSPGSSVEGWHWTRHPTLFLNLSSKWATEASSLLLLKVLLGKMQKVGLLRPWLFTSWSIESPSYILGLLITKNSFSNAWLWLQFAYLHCYRAIQQCIMVWIYHDFSLFLDLTSCQLKTMMWIISRTMFYK